MCPHAVRRTAVWLRNRNNRGGASVSIRSLMYSTFVRILRWLNFLARACVWTTEYFRFSKWPQTILFLIRQNKFIGSVRSKFSKFFRICKSSFFHSIVIYFGGKMRTSDFGTRQPLCGYVFAASMARNLHAPSVSASVKWIVSASVQAMHCNLLQKTAYKFYAFHLSIFRASSGKSKATRATRMW